MKRFSLFAILLTTAIFAKPPQDYGSFFEEFDVVLQQIQVNVLDRDGNPIRGLSKEDFLIELDGKLQEVQTIEEFALEELVDKVDQSNGRVEIPEQARRLFVFFFDLRYSTKLGVLKSQEAARDFITSQMLPTDLAGVFTYTQLRGVSMVTNFTGDNNHLLKAVDSLGLAAAKNVLPGPAGYYLDGTINEVNTLNGFDQFGNLSNAPGRTSDAATLAGQQSPNQIASAAIEEILNKARQVERRNYNREVNAFLASMAKFADGMRFIRGRKNLLWFSTGFDSQSLVGSDLASLSQNAIRSQFGSYEDVSSDQFGDGEVQHNARRAVESLQASGTVVFAMDTSLVNELSSTKAGLQTLNFFAVDTGGRVFTNQNEFTEPLDQVKQITNHYYLVSFYPDSPKKREVGKLRVKVKDQRRAKIYTNRGLLLDPDFKNMTQIEKNIHLSEYIARDQVVRGIPMKVSYIEVPTDSQFVKLSMDVEIDGEYFTAPGVGRTPRDIEIFAFAIDEVNDLVFDQSYFQFKIDPSRASEVLDKTGLKYFANIFVRAGSYKLKVVARDLENGKVGSWIQNVNVDRNNHNLTGPIVLTDKQWVLIRQPEAMERQYKAGNLDFSHPFHVGDKMLVPAEEKVVSRDSKAEIFYMLNYRESPLNNLEPKIQMLFMDEKGEYVMIPPEAISAETELESRAPHLTNVKVSIDMTKVSVQAGQTYQLLTLFDLQGQEPIKSASEIKIL